VLEAGSGKLKPKGLGASLTMNPRPGRDCNAAEHRVDGRVAAGPLHRRLVPQIFLDHLRN
jgi:hypothetical protein